MTEHTKPGARGLILPASHQVGNPSENTLLPDTVAELTQLEIKPREIALDGGFQPTPTNAALAELEAKTVFIAGHQEPASRHTKRRLARYRTGAEGRVSHLKRRYGLDRSRLKRDHGQQIWTEWAILALQHRHPRRPDPVKHSPPLTPREQTHLTYERPRETSGGRFVDQDFFRGK